MIGDHEETVEVEGDEFEAEDSTLDLVAPSANVGEISVEIDVEELIAELEADSGITSEGAEKDSRKRLEDILEQRRASRELEEIDEFDLESVD
jgi:hypothetical protein